MGNNNIDYENKFYCTKCGNPQLFSIPRLGGKQRPAGHLKKMFCFTCNEKRNFVECKPFSSKYTYDDFLIEFNYGNFDREGNRKEKYGLFKDKLVKEHII